jgi:hypothetical protein
MEKVKHRIYNRNLTKWYVRMYSVYKITTRSVLLIDNKFYNISGFEGRLSIVNIDGKIRKIGIKKVREYRYAALEKRRTFCNRIKLSNRYRHDIRDIRCDACYIRARCSMASEGWLNYTRCKVAIKDAMLISQYFEENSNDKQT